MAVLVHLTAAMVLLTTAACESNPSNSPGGPTPSANTTTSAVTERLITGAAVAAQHSPPQPGPARPAGEPRQVSNAQQLVPVSAVHRDTQVSDPTVLADIYNPPHTPKPVQFTTYIPSANPEGEAPVSGDSADISGADTGNGLVLHTGNWYIDVVDGGTVKRYDPTMVFPAPLVGGFCCHQVIIYDNSIHLFVWYMQHKVDAKGDGGFRLAVATPTKIRSNFQTAWTYWDFTDAYFGLSGRELDYPDLAFTKWNLVGTTNVVGVGRLVFRTSTEFLPAGGSISLQYTDPSKSPESIFRFSHIAQQATEHAVIAGHKDTSTLRILDLMDWGPGEPPGPGGGYAYHDVAIATWPNGPLSSKGPDGTDWLDKPWGGTSVSGATFNYDSGQKLVFAWTASAGSGVPGGFSFPHAHVRVVSIDLSSWTNVGEFQVWNPEVAFAYPSLDSNNYSEVGIMVGWGGPKNHANTAEGIIGDYVVWYHNGSELTPDHFGDYITIRKPNGFGNTNEFAAFGYYTVKDASRPSGHNFIPYYSLFSH